jgi:ribosomal protein L11 methylase PrmA
LLDELAPKTVLDLGANTGQYAMMAARKGARVVALDQDEPSVAALYRASRAENLDVLPLVMDLGNPSPANGWCAAQRPDALTRFQADAALMLALIHHLVYTANASLAQVAQLAARATRRHLVLEWVAPEDPMSVHLRRTATKDFSFYTRENLIAALEAEGFTVEAREAHSATRQLLVGTKR